MPTSWNTVIFKFRLIFATDERIIVSGKVFYMVFLGKTIDPRQQKKPGSMGFHKTRMKGLSLNIILRSSVAKIKRNLKLIVFQEMGIESKLLNQISIILFCGRCFI